MAIRIIDRTKEKKCRRCGKLKPLTEFYKDSSARDKHQTWCKVCSQAYYREHADKFKVYHYEKRKTEKWRAAHKRYKRSKKGKAMQAAATKRYYQTVKGKAAKRAMDGRRRARLEEAEGDVSALEIFKLLRDAKACAYCGRTNIDLAIDHVIPLSRGGSHTINNLLPACKSCNSSKCDQLLGEWLPFEWFGPPPEGNRSRISVSD